MKKIVLFFFLILALALPVFAVEAPLLINATIDDGTGVGDEDDIAVGGLKIRLAYQLDGETPSVWKADYNNYRLKADNKVSGIKADLVHNDDSSDLCDSLYLLVGLSGNTSKYTSATISFSIPGWYEGSAGVVEGASKVTGLSLTGSSAVVNVEGNLISSSLGDVGSDDSNGGVNNKAIIVTQEEGLESTVKLVGYSHINWGMTQTVAAGDYSTTITVTVEVTK